MKRNSHAAIGNDDAPQTPAGGAAARLGRVAEWRRRSAAAAAAACLLLLWLNGCSSADSEGTDAANSGSSSADPAARSGERPPEMDSAAASAPLPSASAELSGLSAAAAARRDQAANARQRGRADASSTPSAPVVGSPPQPAAARRNAAAPAPPRPAATPQSRWQAVTERYGAAATYADRGAVEERRGGNVVRGEFQTRFDRASGQFLLTYRANGRGYTVSRDMKGDCWVDDTAADERLARRELAAALQVAKRLTKSAAIIAPGLLFSDALELPAFLRSVSDWHSEGQERVGGRVCHRLRGELFDGGSHVELWIGADESLRRVRLTESSIGRWTTWDFQPRFDQPLPPRSFEPPR